MSVDTPAYRYTLTRDLGVLDSIGTLGWIMLNPSTADEGRDDPTIRKVRGFTLRAGYGGFEVANLFPLRATDPRALHAATEEERIGDADAADAAIVEVCRRSSCVVLAWGSHGARYPHRVATVARLVRRSGRPILALLGMTRGGQPRHPLMAGYDTRLIDVEGYAATLADGLLTVRL